MKSNLSLLGLVSLLSLVITGSAIVLGGCATPAPSATPMQFAPGESPTPGPREREVHLNGIGWRDCNGHLTVWDAKGDVIVDQDMHAGEEYVFASIATPGDYRYRATFNGCCDCESLREVACPTGSSPGSPGGCDQPQEGFFRLPSPEGVKGVMLTYVLVHRTCDAVCKPDPMPTNTGSPAPTGTPTSASTAGPTATPAFWPTGIPRPTRGLTVVPLAMATDEPSCERMGGRWSGGVHWEPMCLEFPTTDAGRPCSDGSECQGWCDPNLDKPGELLKKQPARAPLLMTGICSKKTGLPPTDMLYCLQDGELTPMLMSQCER
jgi:hypothetical protein